MDKEQVQSIYGRGYSDGFEDGIKKMRREGWRHVESPNELEQGDIVRLLKPTIFGFQGRCRVTSKYPGRIVDLERVEERRTPCVVGGYDMANRVTAMYHELAKLYVEEPLRSEADC